MKPVLTDTSLKQTKNNKVPAWKMGTSMYVFRPVYNDRVQQYFSPGKQKFYSKTNENHNYASDLYAITYTVVFF